MSTVIHSYVKGTGSRKMHNVGVLAAAMVSNGKVVIGVSKANVSSGDRFDKVKGTELAFARIQKNLDEGRKIVIPRSMEKDLRKFVERCRKYFKTDVIQLPETEAKTKTYLEVREEAEAELCRDIISRKDS